MEYKYKAGDKVKALYRRESYNEVSGMTGSVVKTDSDGMIEVDFPGFKGGHSGSTEDLSIVSRWWLYPERLSIVESAQEVQKGLRLPIDSQARKEIPLMSGLFDYFPDALVAVARISKKGNDKHNPGQPLHWSRDKSTDHLDCIARHLLDYDKVDEDGELHIDHVIWRACAISQLMKEAKGASKARGAK